jgi:hypothetical protein
MMPALHFGVGYLCGAFCMTISPIIATGIVHSFGGEMHKPFTIDARTNPAVIRFDNGCVLRIFNGATPSDAPTFGTTGPCNDWEWLRRWRAQ